MTIDTKHLRELLAKATPAPWSPNGHFHKAEQVRVLVNVERGAVWQIMRGGNILEQPEFPAQIGWGNRFDDVQLMSALRNAAPALLDELDRLRKEMHDNYRVLTDWVEFMTEMEERDKAGDESPDYIQGKKDAGRIARLALRDLTGLDDGIEGVILTGEHTRLTKEDLGKAIWFTRQRAAISKDAT